MKYVPKLHFGNINIKRKDNFNIQEQIIMKESKYKL